MTVPRPGGPRDLLWQRFSHTFGLDDLDLDVEAERANPSLGVPETTMVRRINVKANKIVPPAAYRPLVRELLAHQTLSRRVDSPRLTLPPDDHAWVAPLQQKWNDLVRERGYDVVGDLDDLVGDPPPEQYADPDAPDEAQVADAAVDAITALLVENARLVHLEQRAPRPARRRPPRPRARAPAADVPLAREDRTAAAGAVGPGGSRCGSTGRGAAGARGRRSARSARSRSRRRPRRRLRRRPGSVGRR